MDIDTARQNLRTAVEQLVEASILAAWATCGNDSADRYTSMSLATAQLHYELALHRFENVCTAPTQPSRGFALCPFGGRRRS
jgi:hypothetical protein